MKHFVFHSGITTYCFTIDDVNRLALRALQPKRLLADVLRQRYGLKCTVRMAKSGPYIYIWKESMNTLRSIVSSYVIPSMRYKLHNERIKHSPLIREGDTDVNG